MFVKSRPVVYSAHQWFPDPDKAKFVNDEYRNRTTGVDEYGVNYLIVEYGIYIDGGFLKMRPGDWIITDPDGDKSVCRKNKFDKMFAIYQHENLC